MGDASPGWREGTPRPSGLKLAPRTHTALSEWTMQLILGALVALVAGCSTAPIPPPYTQQELKERCERLGGWWHEGFLTDGFCEYPGAAQV